MSIIRPDKHQRPLLREAILDAFRNKNNLKMMLSDELDVRLNEIADTSQPLTNIVYDLIEWAEEQDRLEELLLGARRSNLGNHRLQHIERILIPFAYPDTIIRYYGPEINYRGSTEALELQGLWKAKPIYLDIGFVQQALTQAKSVCWVEINGRPEGTGFLLTQNLVLTNFHVLAPFPQQEIAVNPQNIKLRFGRYTNELGEETPGQIFKLDSHSPILHSSRTDNLDYVLLQVEDAILQAENIQPVSWNQFLLPTGDKGINILQHPDGETMKMALSQDGITGVYQENNIVQYISKTNNLSSGSPCFNDNWQLVALHHAIQQKPFGIVGEGILFSAIYQEIQQYLAS
jgi:endonuclease G, mitochondrial